ncbi:MAG: F0F1 ATP synthase subunit A [Muribaculaceae bacterium]|nr:F0F1 ATP synthase subunit A [Muribaculaceae bacterium]
MKNKRSIILIIMLLVLPFTTTLKASGHADEGGELDVKGLIFHHLLDSYEWELPCTHAKLPLPIIVRDYQGDWHLFSSSRLAHGEEYEGFKITHEGDNSGKVVGTDAQGNEYRPLDFSITKNVSEIMLATIIILWLLLSMARWYKKNPNKAPRKLFGGVELLIEMVYVEVIKPILGHDAKRFAPYLLTIFFFIFTINLIGMISVFPGGANLSGNIAVTLVLAVMTFLVVNIFGTKHYWKDLFWPEVPMFMKFPIPIMPVIEVFGALTKPVALMIRLFANMMGGHMITLVLISLIFIFAALGQAVQTGTAVFSILFALFMGVLHLLICLIQAYVFTMLSTIFIGLAQIHGHKEEKKE